MREAGSDHRLAVRGQLPSLVLFVALSLLLVACEPGSSDDVSVGPSITVPTTASTTLLPTSTTVSPSPTTTASPAATVLPLAGVGNPPLRVLFSVPVGDGGITYEGGFDDWEISGPQAITVAGDGSIWIADTDGRRLLHYSESGTLLGAVDTDAYGVAGLIDIAATDAGIWGLEVVPALDRHRLVLFDDLRGLVAEYELPAGLHLQDGLSGIAATPDGGLWIELEGGARVFLAFDGTGAFAPTLVDGYEIDGMILRPAPTDGGLARFTVGDVTIERPIREQGGFTFEGSVPGWAVLLLSDVWFDASGTLTVDLEFVYVGLDGTVAATATYPLGEVAAAAYVPQEFAAVAPDGRLIAMKPGADSLDVVELALVPAGDASS